MSEPMSEYTPTNVIYVGSAKLAGGGRGALFVPEAIFRKCKTAEEVRDAASAFQFKLLGRKTKPTIGFVYELSCVLDKDGKQILRKAGSLVYQQRCAAGGLTLALESYEEALTETKKLAALEARHAKKLDAVSLALAPMRDIYIRAGFTERAALDALVLRRLRGMR